MARLRSLDGLRGIAALVVVIHHCLLLSPVLAGSYREAPVEGWGLDRLLTRTPLHLLWDGTGAVLVFFVLSGYVLTLAATRSGRDGWSAYYVKRLPRLYLPVWAGLAFAVVLAELVPRVIADGQSWWLNAHAQTVTPSLVAGDASLLKNASLIDSPLWSLRWELWFSLLLPGYIWLAVHAHRLVCVQAAGLLGLIGLGSWSGHASLLYLPVFGFGVLLAAHRDSLTAALARIGRAGWVVIGCLAVAMLTAGFTVGPDAEWVDRPLRSVGACFMVLLFLGCPGIARYASGRVPQWLGAVSFSLYLVHEPIAVSVAMLLHPTDSLGAYVVLAISLPLSMIVAAAFLRWVERPSLEIGRRLARREARGPGMWGESVGHSAPDAGSSRSLVTLPAHRS